MIPQQTSGLARVAAALAARTAGAVAGVTVGLLAGAFAITPAAASGGDGWTSEWEYAGQGADWYGTRLREMRRDYPPTAVDEASDGEDYGLGYDARYDRFGLGPPVAATNAGSTEYVFRFGDRPSEGDRCYLDLDCQDGVFCNGAERCSRTMCRGSLPPDCDDGDPCTSDFCHAKLDRCRSLPLSRAPEVQGLELDHDGVYVRMRWSATPGAEHYNVYRGQWASLSDLACHAAGVPEPAFEDDGALPKRRLFVHLVTAVGCGAESTLGANSDGEERRPVEACP